MWDVWILQMVGCFLHTIGCTRRQRVWQGTWTSPNCLRGRSPIITSLTPIVSLLPVSSPTFQYHSSTFCHIPPSNLYETGCRAPLDFVKKAIHAEQNSGNCRCVSHLIFNLLHCTYNHVVNHLPVLILTLNNSCFHLCLQKKPVFEPCH